jgi:hypothetical protein
MVYTMSHICLGCHQPKLKLAIVADMRNEIGSMVFKQIIHVFKIRTAKGEHGKSWFQLGEKQTNSST